MTGSEYQAFELGDWLVEPEFARISRTDVHISIQPKAMELLVYLARSNGHVVSADDILDDLWGDVVVASGSVYFCINQLREALGDDSHHPTYIETIAKRGYRLIAPVRFVGDEDGGPDAPELISKTAGGDRRKIFALTGLLGMALLVVAYQYMNGAPTQDLPAAERSIAVLPFVDLSPDGDQEYFADGIAEDLLNALAKVPQLKVTGRTSSFTFRDRNENLRAIGKVLGVAHILEGSVRRDGARVRITAQLIKASDSFHIWSETYDRELVDIFAVQEEIATAIARALAVELLGNLPIIQATNPEAYALVLQARYLVLQYTPDAFERAIGLLKTALALDPGYAAAWAGLARAYRRQTGQGLRPYDKGYPLAREAALEALALDPTNALAHGILGGLSVIFDRDFAAAVRHYERALAAEPASTVTLNSAALMAAYLGRMDLAIALAKYAVARDPVNPTSVYGLGIFYLRSGHLDEALISLRTGLTLSPDYIGAQFYLGETLLLKGDLRAALAAMQKEGYRSRRLQGLVVTHHALGDAAASDAALAELIENFEQQSAYNIAFVLAFRGEADRAFEWLQKAVLYDDPGLTETIIEPLFGKLRSDPRWLPFLASIGKSPEQLAAINFEVTLPE